LSAPLAALIGARIRRVDVPDPDLVALSLGASDLRTVLVLATDASHAGLGCVSERPRGRPAEGVAKQLRNLVEGARVERAIDAGGGALALDLRRGPDSIALVHEALAERSNVLVLDAGGHVVAALHPSRLASRSLALGEPWSPLDDGDAPPRDLPGDLDALLARGAALLDLRRGELERTRRRALERALRRAAKRVARRVEATRGDLERASEAPALRARGAAVLAALATIPRGATDIELTDWTSDPPGTLRVSIDPERGPRGTADALFARARKLEAGARIAQTRHDDARRIAAEIATLLGELERPGEHVWDELEARARALGATDTAAPSRRRAPEAHRPFRRYTGHADRAILVGKGASDNDALTFEHASPHDLWMHARGVAGSHVIVPLARGEACPAELLVDAAHLAAHFSSARGEAQIEVQYAPRKHVRKAKGGAPGRVIVAQERSLLLRVEPARIERLLAPSQVPSSRAT
jgi:predicted ribosome quality control (RQC) complex YloA/Tae2 family protein